MVFTAYVRAGRCLIVIFVISKSVLENLFNLNISSINFIVTIPLLIKTGATPMQESCEVKKHTVPYRTKWREIVNTFNK